ncbi:flagellin FlaB [Methanomicrobium sp. W14]|uniref:archaellin/type IV pilin N-terminal domain-containing protein n=1 Tax=Methanomicrobium sp. W14 TaxID=2817839 RepID=UPI001AEA48E5|nr:archaellin/type IV pilin N-terminal domain-containing protein [Methanomicrobium sp. W14]MBP2132974.1 flagellin FlaB [Methanomicrobium sp. W14]
MAKLFKSEEGFTGLEAAIVLIAFVVVAAVFSYVVLGAGFFTTQKAQQVVYSSVDMASSSLEVLGDVYGNGTNSYIDGVRFVVGLTSGGSSVDFANTNLVFTNTTAIVDLINSSKISSSGSVIDTLSDLQGGAPNTWGIIDIANGDDGALLENEEQFTIYAKLDSTAVAPNEEFTIEVKPPEGTTYAIKRGAPAKIEKVNILY